MKKASWKTIRKWITIVGIVYVIIGAAFWFFQDRFIFRPQRLAADYTFQFDIPFRERNLRQTDKKILSIVQFTVPDSLRKGIVLYFHGNRGNINRYAPYAKSFTRNGYEVWMMDYPGYGKSTGQRSEAIFYADALQLYKLAIKEVSAEHIIFYGKSLGSGIAAQLASVRDCRRLILETPYYDFSAVVRRFLPVYPVSWLLKYQLPTADYLQLVRAPVSIIHGTEDGLVPYKNARRLQAAFKTGDELITVSGGSHNNLFDYAQVQQKIDSLLRLP